MYNKLSKDLIFVICDKRVDQNFGTIDKLILLQRLNWLDFIWDVEEIDRTSINILLIKLLKVTQVIKPPRKILQRDDVK